MADAGLSVDAGFGATIAFATSSFDAEIKSFSLSFERGEIDTSHLGSTAVSTSNHSNATFIPGDIVRATMDFTGHFNTSQDDATHYPLTSGASEQITVTFPNVNTTGATYVFNGFATSFEVTGETESAIEFSCSVRIAGTIAVTAATSA